MTLTDVTRTPEAAPRALRSRPPGWRNARLLVGLLLVAGSVLVGARLMASADDSVAVWGLTHDLPAGAPVTEDDLVVRRVRFTEADTANGYVAATDLPAPGTTLNRAVSRGELLPRSAVATTATADLAEVPLSVATDDLPATVRVGSTVDVWVTPELPPTDRRQARAVRVLREVQVVGVPRLSQGLGPQATRQVILGLPISRVGELETALGAISGGRVIVAKVG